MSHCKRTKNGGRKRECKEKNLFMGVYGFSLFSSFFIFYVYSLCLSPYFFGRIRVWIGWAFCFSVLFTCMNLFYCGWSAVFLFWLLFIRYRVGLVLALGVFMSDAFYTFVYGKVFSCFFFSLLSLCVLYPSQDQGTEEKGRSC